MGDLDMDVDVDGEDEDGDLETRDFSAEFGLQRRVLQCWQLNVCLFCLVNKEEKGRSQTNNEIKNNCG